MNKPFYSKRPVPRRSVTQLKRIAYTLALILGGTSMVVELWLGSPTQDMVPTLVAQKRKRPESKKTSRS